MGRQGLYPFDVLDDVCLAALGLHTHYIICDSPLQELPCIIRFLYKASDDDAVAWHGQLLSAAEEAKDLTL